MDIIKIVFIGITGVFLSAAIKKDSPQFSLLIGLATGVCIIFLIAGYLKDIFDIFKGMSSFAGIDSAYLGIVLKVIAIAYICEFGIALCKDAGEQSIAGKIELSGKILIMAVSAPVILALMELILGLV